MNQDGQRPVNVVIAGVGGQGVLLASRLLCGAAVKVGLQVQALEEHGMAQRGGAVTTQLRVARRKLFTAQIRPGTGQVLLAFEPMEGLRALPLLDPEAQLLINTHQLPPPSPPGSGSKDQGATASHTASPTTPPPNPPATTPTTTSIPNSIPASTSTSTSTSTSASISTSSSTSLDMLKVERLLKVSYPRVHLFDATALAEKAGSGLAVNMVLVGGLAALDLLPAPLGAEALHEALVDWVRPALLEINQRAFQAGHDSISSSNKM